MAPKYPYPVYCVNCRRSMQESDIFCPYCKQDQRPGAPDINEVKRRQQAEAQAASWKAQQEAIAAKQSQQAKPKQGPIITPPPSQPTQTPPEQPGISCSSILIGLLIVITFCAIVSVIPATPPPVNNTHTSATPSGGISTPTANTQPQPTPVYDQQPAPPVAQPVNRTLHTPAQKLIRGNRRNKDGFDEPALFMSTFNYRGPGMKIYTNSGVNTYELFATYISSEGEYNKVVFPDGASNEVIDAFVDRLVTDYIAPN